jgi:hypothetical protein
MTEDEKEKLRALLEAGDKDAWGVYGSVIRTRRTQANAAASRENGKKGGRPKGSKDTVKRTRSVRKAEDSDDEQRNTNTATQ